MVVWGGPARLRYHGVLPLKEGHHPLVGDHRIQSTHPTGSPPSVTGPVYPNEGHGRTSRRRSCSRRRGESAIGAERISPTCHTLLHGSLGSCGYDDGAQPPLCPRPRGRAVPAPIAIALSEPRMWELIGELQLRSLNLSQQLLSHGSQRRDTGLLLRHEEMKMTTISSTRKSKRVFVRPQ